MSPGPCDTGVVPWEPLPTGPDDEPAPMAPTLDRLVRHLGASSTGTLQQVFGRWPELVGAQVADHSRPVRLREGVLSLVVDEPAWATQLRLLEAELLTRLAAVLGPGVVTGLRVRVGPLEGAGAPGAGGAEPPVEGRPGPASRHGDRPPASGR